MLDAQARDALVGEALALVTRCPKLARGFDRNGLPIATKETRAWLSALRGPTQAAAKPADNPSPTPPTAAAPDALPPEVDALLTKGKVTEGLRLGSATAAGLVGRDAFARNLLLAERLRDGDSKRLALPLFRALLRQLRSSSLAQWEPKVGSRCIRGYLQCANANNDAIDDERALLDELMLLDPSAAVGLV